MSAIESRLNVSGRLFLRHLPQFPTKIDLETVLKYGLPNKQCTAEERTWRKSNTLNFIRNLDKVAEAQLRGIPTLIGAVWLRKICGQTGFISNLGLAGVQIVTNAGVNYIAARMANSSPANISLFNFHGLGTGNTAAAVTDTALQTELTTQYNPDSTRATGAQSNPSANVYQSLGTNTLDGSAAVTEWGLLTQAATGGGTLLDRIVFSVINLASGDSLQTTFQFTIASGG